MKVMYFTLLLLLIIKAKEGQLVNRLFGNTLQCAVTYRNLTNMSLFRKMLTCEIMTLKHDLF